MTSTDFKKLKYFDENEITRIPGEDLARIKFPTIRALDYFRGGIMYPVAILAIVSGRHTLGSKHPNGTEADIRIIADEQPSIEEILWVAAKCGFTGAGFYWNGACESYHLGMGYDKPTTWRGWKPMPGKPFSRESEWLYAPLIGDIKARPRC